MQAEEILKPVLFDQLEEIREKVLEGVYDLIKYSDGTYLVVWVDRENKEITGIGLVGKGYKEKVREWMQKAFQYGYSIRIHSHRKGIGRMLKSLGFEFEFLTMVKRIED